MILLGICGMEDTVGLGAFIILMISSALKRAGLCSHGVLTFIEEAESGAEVSLCGMSHSSSVEI
jgi:hypothetical protein